MQTKIHSTVSDEKLGDGLGTRQKEPKLLLDYCMHNDTDALYGSNNYSAHIVTADTDLPYCVNKYVIACHVIIM